MAYRINSVLLLATVVFASFSEQYGDCFGPDSKIEDGTYETCSECCDVVDKSYDDGDFPNACSCGIDFLSPCLAFCNGFIDEEIQEGTCDQNLCELKDCESENGFCNWYKHPVSPNPPCNVKDDGVFCVRPSLLRACTEHITGTEVCGFGLTTDMNFPNACFAKAAGYDNYVEGPCESKYAENAMVSLDIFGDSPMSQFISLMSSNAYGTFVPSFNSTYEEPDCGCDYNWDPVCLRTGLISFTFMNDCLAQCRKKEQSVAYNQVYWPETAYLIDGECPEPCLGVQCDEGTHCATWGEDHTTCVPIDQNLCQDKCYDDYLEEKICVRQWLGFNDESWFLRNKCHAIQCLGIPEIHRYDKGDCQDQCTDEVCTQEDKDTDVCVFPEALGIRETVSRCKAKCQPSHWSVYMEGPCDNTNCTKTCPVENNPICVNGKQFMSPCEANCEFNLDADDADQLDISEDPYCTETFQCSADDDECCDKIDSETAVSNYGTCPDYAPGNVHAKFCNDPIANALIGKSGFVAGMQVSDVCPFSCVVCGSSPTPAPEFKKCNEEGTCCNLISESADATSFGECAKYEPPPAGKFHNFCSDDKVLEENFAAQGWNKGDTHTVDELCKFSCNSCGTDEPKEVQTVCDDSGECCEPKDVEVTTYGNCESYGSGEKNSKYCSDSVLPEFQVDGAKTVKDVCKLSCKQDVPCGEVDETDVQTCVDKQGSSWGACSTYVEGQSNHQYCDKDGMKAWANCPVACKLEECAKPAKGECEDSKTADAGYGGCSTYAPGEPNQMYCDGDGMIAKDKCPKSCNNPDCVGDGDGDVSLVCKDIEGTASKYGNCASYAVGGNNYKTDGSFCKSDSCTSDECSDSDKVIDACPTSCGVSGCGGDDGEKEEGEGDVECDPDDDTCCDTVPLDVHATNYGPCKSYQSGGKNHKYCDDDTGKDNTEWQGTAVKDLCKFSCQKC